MAQPIDRSPIRPEEWAEARRYALVIEWSEENDAYLATAPDLPAVVTDGRTRAEAAEMGEEAVAVFLSSLRDRGQLIPEPAFTGLPEHLRPTQGIAGARRSA